MRTRQVGGWFTVAMIVSAAVIMVISALVWAAVAHADFIEGTNNDDYLNGTSGKDEIWGFQGQDILDGFGDTDELRGNAGGDNLYGGTSADDLFGGISSDGLNGGDHRDRIFSGDGADGVYAIDGWADVIDCGGTDGDVDVVWTEAYALDYIAPGCNVIHDRSEYKSRLDAYVAFTAFLVARGVLVDRSDRAQ